MSSFEPLRQALKEIGFYHAEETARGAEWVTHEYARILESGTMRNFITTACPSACRLVQEYFPEALPYLAPVASPMVAHARILLHENPDAEIVFIGPCLAKHREAAESGVVSAVLSFDEIARIINLKENQNEEAQPVFALNHGISMGDPADVACRAKGYPVTDGIIHSFGQLPKGYHYMSVDGPKRAMEVLENIDNYEGVFIEINICPNGCINGPFSLLPKGGTTKAKLEMQQYLMQGGRSYASIQPGEDSPVDLSYEFPRVLNRSRKATDKEIEEVLRRTGKLTKADELDCGACGYRTCREKAWAVVNGYADIDICLPYMRKRAESLAVDIVRNSPEGVMIVDPDMNIVDINASAMKMLGLTGTPESVVGRPVAESFQPIDFYNAYSKKQRVENPRLHITSTNRYLSLTVSLLSEQNLLFGLMKDISDMVNYDKKLEKVRMDTISTTDDLIMKQMRVAQEIASLLGETTAETKVALLKLKKTLSDGQGDLGVDGRPTDWKTAKV